MNSILAITLLTYKEGLRHRVLYGVIVFALLVMGSSVLISGMFMRDISKIILDFCLTAVSVGGLLIPFFLAITLLARDIERKTVFSILSRPVSRGQYILGKFGGITLLTGTIMTILLVVTFVSIFAGKQLYGANYFSSFSIPAVLLGIFFNFCGIIVLNGLVVLWCSLTTSSFLATMLTLATYLIGHSVDDMVRFIANPPPGIDISKSVQVTVKLAQYLFPNLAAFDLKLQAAHGIILPVSQYSLLLLYGAAYTTAALALALLAFSRRDLS